jgi:hypothetical protein
MAIAA